MNDNLILGHNVNYDNGTVKNDDSVDEDAQAEHDLEASQESFEGAINGDPELNGHCDRLSPAYTAGWSR